MTTQSLKVTSVTPTGGTVTFGNYTSQTYSSGTVNTTTNTGPFAIASNVLDAPLTASATNNSATVTIGMDTTGAGPQSGNAVFAFQSVQGKSIATASTTLNSQTVTFTGTGYRAAIGSVSTTNVSLGNFRVGAGAQTGSITVSNSLANDGYSEKLGIVDASVQSGPATADSIPAGLIAAGSNVSVTLGLSGIATPGVITGTVRLGLKSSGFGTSGLSDLALASQDVTIIARGYRTAAYDAPDVDLGKYHVGASDVAGNVLVYNTTSSADIYSEKLGVTKGTQTGLTAGTASGLIAAGANGSIGVTLGSVSAVGTNTASIVFNMTSDGTGTSGLSALSLGSKTVNVSATGYSGQSVWSQNTGGTWATFANWDVPGGKPGVDGSLSVDAEPPSAPARPARPA